ncbi:hypothetical protein PP352_21645 [Mycobacteroides abscessus]|nr:hypothetical protein [Mycobacteroides abscessus]
MVARTHDYHEEWVAARARCARLALWPPLSAVHRAQMIDLELRAGRLSLAEQYANTPIMAASWKELDDITEQTRSIAAQYDCTAISLETFAAEGRRGNTARPRIALALTGQEAELIVHALQNTPVVTEHDATRVRDLAERIHTEIAAHTRAEELSHGV